MAKSVSTAKIKRNETRINNARKISPKIAMFSLVVVTLFSILGGFGWHKIEENRINAKALSFVSAGSGLKVARCKITSGGGRYVVYGFLNSSSQTISGTVSVNAQIKSFSVGPSAYTNLAYTVSGSTYTEKYKYIFPTTSGGGGPAVRSYDSLPVCD